MEIAGVPVPGRHESLQAARDRGLKTVAALPYHLPRALLRAHGFHALEVWAPPGAAGPLGGDAQGVEHFQAYACSIVRSGTAFLLGEAFGQVDAVLVPHGCDALQGMGSVLTDFVGDRPPVLTLYPPRGRRRVDRDYLAAELAQLGRRLTEISGVDPDAAAWAQAGELEDRADDALAGLYRRRAGLALTDAEFSQAVRTREYLLAEDFVRLAEALPTGTPKVPADAVPLVLSGIVAEPWLLQTLTEAGARVVADDLGCGSRRLLPFSAVADPIDRWVDRFLRGPADPTRADPVADRVDRVRHLVEVSRARGVVVFDPPFCEPEQFYLPGLKAALTRHDVPLLVVEHESAAAGDGRLTARIEAFVETLS